MRICRWASNSAPWKTNCGGTWYNTQDWVDPATMNLITELGSLYWNLERTTGPWKEWREERMYNEKSSWKEQRQNRHNLVDFFQQKYGCWLGNIYKKARWATIIVDVHRRYLWFGSLLNENYQTMLHVYISWNKPALSKLNPDRLQNKPITQTYILSLEREVHDV